MRREHETLAEILVGASCASSGRGHFVSGIQRLVAFRLSFAYFVWKYPNDGQDVLGSVFLALVIGPVVEIIGFVHLLLLQRARTAKSRCDRGLPCPGVTLAKVSSAAFFASLQSLRSPHRRHRRPETSEMTITFRKQQIPGRWQPAALCSAPSSSPARSATGAALPWPLSSQPRCSRTFRRHTRPPLALRYPRRPPLRFHGRHRLLPLRRHCALDRPAADVPRQHRPHGSAPDAWKPPVSPSTSQVRKPASYHSYLAKTWGLVMAIAVIVVFATIARNHAHPGGLALGIACNLEGLTMSLLLPPGARTSNPPRRPHPSPPIWCRPTGGPREAQYAPRSGRPTRSGPVRQDCIAPEIRLSPCLLAVLRQSASIESARVSLIPARRDNHP